MRKTTRRSIGTLCLSSITLLSVALLSPLALAAQEFQAQPVQAALGPERDEYTSSKVPPMDDALRTDDGRVRVIVQLAEPPLALYDGRLAGFKATSPAVTGERKLDLKSASARAYRVYLAKRQATLFDALTKSALDVTLLGKYDVVFNGVAMAVAPDAIDEIAKTPGVKRVYPDRMYYSTMDASLPLIEAPALWAELGGRDHAGAGIKVAVVDGGIRPENPMFDGAGFSFPPGFPLADDYCGAVDASFCNGKLIAARHFRTVALHPSEHDTPLGFNGHGTHVAGTAVGNFVSGVTTSDGVPEDISGVAPGAWLMVYKALWWNGTTGSGSSVDLIAAVDAAVADGADVINNSWGGPGGEDPNLDVFGATFEAANAAGVLSVVAAGNAGPGADSIGCPGCHLVALTVGNSTTNRIHALGFELSGGPSAGCLEGTGPTLGASVGPQTVVYAGDVGDPLGCSAFPAGSMTGATALISRGVCAFAVKVGNAVAAGADYVVVFNNAPGAPIVMGALEPTTVSSCMISDTDGAAAVAFVSGNAGAQGTIDYPASRQTNDAWEDFMAASSSRGPNGDPDFLKPDVAAPGTRILSATSPEQGGQDFTFLNGTSMASPHVAGAAALLLHQHPTWTPEQIKTALTSTSVRGGLVKEDGVTAADPFDRGAGRLNLERAGRAGATFDLPSMADSVCVVGCSFTRTIRNHVGHGNGKTTWYASVESDDPKLGIKVTPDQVKLRPNQSASFQVDVDTTLVADDDWQFGAVKWSTKKNKAGGHDDDDDDDGDDDDGDDDDDGHGHKNAPSAHLPIAAFAASSTDPSQLTKAVDKPTAAQGEVLTYDISLNNLTLTDPISLTDAIPSGSEFVAGSESALVNGLPDPTFTYDAGSDSLSWSGMLDPQTLELVPSPSPFGYVPLNIFVPPLTCSAVCDDTSITLSGVNFNYAGVTYNAVVMSSNGFFVAGGDATNAFTPFNQDLPDPAAPNNVVAPFWTDLDLDGISPTDSGAGNMFAALLSAGPNTYLVLEWQGAELFGVPGVTFTFQVWVQQGTSNIWIVYAGVPGIPSFLTVGVEDATGGAGSSRYFDGTGTAPAVGTDLMVEAAPGGTATFTFQVEAKCNNSKPIVNVVDVTSGPTTLTALAATEITPAPPGACDDDDDDDDDGGHHGDDDDDDN
jgi:uncharacterized repeat protein (TIGR01451 family)